MKEFWESCRTGFELPEILSLAADHTYHSKTVYTSGFNKCRSVKNTYLRCSIPTGAEPAPSSSPPAAATRHQTTDPAQLGDDIGTVRRGEDSDGGELALNDPAHTHHPYRRRFI